MAGAGKRGIIDSKIMVDLGKFLEDNPMEYEPAVNPHLEGKERERA